MSQDAFSLVCPWVNKTSTTLGYMIYDTIRTSHENLFYSFLDVPVVPWLCPHARCLLAQQVVNHTPNAGPTSQLFEVHFTTSEQCVPRLKQGQDRAVCHWSSALFHFFSIGVTGATGAMAICKSRKQVNNNLWGPTVSSAPTTWRSFGVNLVTFCDILWHLVTLVFVGACWRILG